MFDAVALYFYLEGVAFELLKNQGFVDGDKGLLISNFQPHYNCEGRKIALWALFNIGGKFVEGIDALGQRLFAIRKSMELENRSLKSKK
ncbi:MAG: hypothetical protein MZU97_25505 [Bacillus subtilis]|nr:hypothetical protein [Bacillus subtilis]